MPSEIISAIIAAVVGTLSSLITLTIGLGQLRNERKRLEEEMKLERAKLEHDRERLQSELRENAEQARVWKAEVEKLKAETQKLSIEADDIRRRQLEAERTEIRDLLVLFDRAVFDAPMQSEEPVEMFRALQQTRVSLQKSGASLVRHQEIAMHFQRIRQILLETETEVKRRYPRVVQLAIELDENIPVRRYQVNQLLGEDYWGAVGLMMGIRPEITQHVEAIRKRLRVLDEQIG
jgi:seryl-tRNA synthetase